MIFDLWHSERPKLLPVKLDNIKTVKNLKMEIDRQKSSMKRKEATYGALSIGDTKIATRRHLAAKTTSGPFSNKEKRQ
jgi:hypothetical protein